MPKLTLSTDSKTIAQAKRLAAQNHTSVSAMFTRLIRAMTKKPKTDDDIGPLTRELTGIIKLPKGKTDRDVLTDALMEKYGFDE